MCPASSVMPAAISPAPAASSSTPAPAASSTPEAPEASSIKVGLICVEDENSGYDFMHIEGFTKACKDLGITDMVFKYDIPEDETCYDTAVDLAEQGCQVIFSNSYGHQSHMLSAAMEYPDVTFVSCTGDMAGASGLDNYKNIFPDTYQSRYVSGVVAGMKLKEMLDSGEATDPYVGYVGAYPYAEVVSGYSAFFLGIRSIVPDAHMDVTYTNSWYDPTGEGEAANALMAKGAVIIGQHADSTGAPSAVQAAYQNGAKVYSVGYNIDMQNVAPDVALTSAQNNWSVLYEHVLSQYLAGEDIDVDYSAGINEGAVMIADLGKCVADGTAEAVEAAWNGIKDGSVKVFATDSFTCQPATDGSYQVDGDGHVTSAFGLDADGDFVNDHGEAISNGEFVESILRSAPYFSLRIDGITELN